MNDISPHKNLEAWKMAMELVTRSYKLTAELPESEKFGLRSQMRRAAVSIPSNIAEGAAGRSNQHFAKYLTNAIGSLIELETQFEICLRLNFLHEADCEPVLKQLISCKKVTMGLRKAIRRRDEE